jgi:hypothetical protein
MDEYERRKALVLIEQLVREGRPAHQIDREVEELVDGGTDSPPPNPRCAPCSVHRSGRSAVWPRPRGEPLSTR